MTLQSPTDTLIPLLSSSELTGCGYPGLLDRKNHSDICDRWESTLDFLHARRAPYPLGQALHLCIVSFASVHTYLSFYNAFTINLINIRVETSVDDLHVRLLLSKDQSAMKWGGAYCYTLEISVFRSFVITIISFSSKQILCIKCFTYPLLDFD